ncbi:TMV resistance protein N-like protein [Tanacetum coccineum]
MEEMLAKFIDEGKCEHEEIEIFIKEFRTTNELLLKERRNLLSELKIKVNELSKITGNVLIPENKVKGVITRRGKMTSEATPSKEINEPRINKNEPPKFKQEVQEKPHDVGVKNKSSSIPERTTQPLLKSKFNDDQPCQDYFSEEPYAFKLCSDNIMRRCVAGSETLKILAHCHSRPTGGHHGTRIIANKVYKSGFYWPSVFKDASEYLNKLAELRDGAYENTRIYKERAKKWHDSRLRGDKDFKASDKCFKVNGQRLKKYYEGNFDKEGDEVIEFEERCKRRAEGKKAFAKNTKKEADQKWRDAMKEPSNLAGWELKSTANGDESKLIQIIVDNKFKKLRSISSSIDGKLVGMEMRINEVLTSLKICTEDVRVIGINGMGGGGKITLARAVYVYISSEFEGKIFVENVREVSKTSLSGLNLKVLVVLDDVDHIDQLEVLAGKPNWIKSESTIIITTRDKQVLVSHGVSLIRNVNLLSDKEVLCLFNRYTFGREIPIQGYEQLSRQVVRYAAGLPLTIRVLGSFQTLGFLGQCGCANFESFSRSICSLNFLRKLTLEGSILEVAKDLHRLECLEELAVLNTEITHVPYSVCRLKQLKSLKLQDCQHLEELTKYFGQLKSLKELSLANIKIKHLPVSICLLKQLKSLKLESCQDLKRLPPYIGELESLEELILLSTGIESLSYSVCSLKQLKFLKLQDCQHLTEFPEGLRIIGSKRTLELCGLTPVNSTSDNGDYGTFCYTVV